MFGSKKKRMSFVSSGSPSTLEAAPAERMGGDGDFLPGEFAGFVERFQMTRIDESIAVSRVFDDLRAVRQNRGLKIPPKLPAESIAPLKNATFSGRFAK